MTLSNDDKIKQYSDKIENKRKKLGTKPRASYVTNGLIQADSNNLININVQGSVKACVGLAATLAYTSMSWNKACEWLDVDADKQPMKYGQYTLEECVEDIKTRCGILRWTQENNKLSKMDDKLKSLLSESAKTEAAISDIVDNLDLD